MMGHDYMVLLVLGILFLSMSACQAYSPSVSDPEKVNEIIPEIDTPQIDPGSSEKIQIILNNPYNHTMENISLTFDIYKFNHLDEEKDISKIAEPPVFEKSGEKNITVQPNSIENDSVQKLQYDIGSKDGTEEGVYLLRSKLEFIYLKEEIVMKSRGYFTSEEWEGAKVEDDKEYRGGFNLTELGVNGILPDSSFSVKRSLSRWPQYALGAAIGLSSVLAVMFYMQEKYGSFPRLEKTFDNWTDKFRKFRRRFEKRFD